MRDTYVGCATVSSAKTSSECSRALAACRQTPTVLPMIIRVRLLAGLAAVMTNPLEQLSRLRQSRAFGPQFDRVLSQDPIVTPNTFLQGHLT